MNLISQVGKELIVNDGDVVTVGLDVSGGVSQYVFDGLLIFLKSKFMLLENIKIYVWMFDTRAYGPFIFSENNLDELTNLIPCGGGGTLLEPVYQAMSTIPGTTHKILLSDCYFVDDFQISDPLLYVYQFNTHYFSPPNFSIGTNLSVITI